MAIQHHPDDASPRGSRHLTRRGAPRWRLVATLFSTVAVAVACGADKDDATRALPPPQAIVATLPSPLDDPPRHPPDTFIGSSSGDGPYVALVLRGKEALAYACDGTSGDWFGGTVNGNSIAARSQRGTVIEATRDGSRLVGSVNFNDDEHRFTLAPPAGVEAGLFREHGKEKAKLGWVVLGPDRIRGVTEGTDGKTVATEQGVSNTSPTVGADGGGGASPTSTTTTTRPPVQARGIYSKVFRETFNNCGDVDTKRKDIKVLYGVDPQTGEGCDGNKDCETFRAELNRISDALKCIRDPFF